MASDGLAVWGELFDEVEGPEEASQLGVPLLESMRYSEVGLCIYCGEEEGKLTDEHIIPYGLGGNLVLPKASCLECAKITGQFECKVLRGPLRPIRIKRRIQSRRKHRDAPTELPIQVRFADGWKTIRLPLEEYPLILQFFVYPPPGFLDPEYVSGIRVSGQMTYSFGPRPHEVLKKLGAVQLRMPQTYVPSAFAKMTAKVAYSMAVAVGAVDPVKGRPEVVRSILGEIDEVGRWIGTLVERRRWVAGVLHHVSIQADHEKGILLGRVQYMTDSGTPDYGVILGRLDDPFVIAPSHATDV